jgi:hypothetical protein
MQGLQCQLDAAIKSGEGKDSLREAELRDPVLRSYFGGDDVAEAPPAGGAPAPAP